MTNSTEQVFLNVPIEGNKKLTLSRDAISLKSFAEFVMATEYKTIFEDFYESDTWLNSSWTEGEITIAEAFDSMWSAGAVVQMAKRDAHAYCEWHGGIRLPNLMEIISAVCYFEEKEESLFINGSCAYDLIDNCQEGDAIMVPSIENIRQMQKFHPSKSVEDMMMETLCWIETDTAVASFRVCKSEV
jgi:hypothetical protein